MGQEHDHFGFEHFVKQLQRLELDLGANHHNLHPHDHSSNRHPLPYRHQDLDDDLLHNHIYFLRYLDSSSTAANGMEQASATKSLASSTSSEHHSGSSNH